MICEVKVSSGELTENVTNARDRVGAGWRLPRNEVRSDPSTYPSKLRFHGKVTLSLRFSSLVPLKHPSSSSVCLKMGVVEKAVTVPEILSEIIFLASPLDYVCNRDCVRDHLNLISVSKLWAKITIPIHWKRHASFRHYISLLYDEPWQDNKGTYLSCYMGVLKALIF